MRYSYLFALIFLSQVTLAGDLTFADAKARSCNDEGGLSADSSEALTTSQETVVSTAFSTCQVAVDVIPPPFTVVVELDANGSVRKTWRSDDTSFVRCFEGIAAQSKLFVPPHAPFYSSFEIDLRPSNTKG